MEQNHTMPSTTTGTLCGFTISVFANIDSQDLLKTSLLAIVGAVVGFVTTLFLKWIVTKIKNVSGK